MAKQSRAASPARRRRNWANSRRCCCRATATPSQPQWRRPRTQPRCPISAISPSAAFFRPGFSSNPAEAERLAAALEGLREYVRGTVAQALALYGREETENLRNEILRNAPL